MSDSHRAGLSAAATSPDDVTAIRPENAAWALAEIGRLKAERDYLRNAWTRAVITDKQTGKQCNPPVTYERASAEAEALVAAALAEFKKASEPEGGGA